MMSRPLALPERDYPMLELAHYIIVGATGVTVVLAVGLHYEVFRRLADWLARPARSYLRTRERLLGLVLTLIVVHVAEIWLFGTVGWILTSFVPGGGEIGAPYAVGFLDHIYLSAATFTTVGYGEVYPLGPVRFLFGTEALTGFALITWSASLTFLEMQRNWQTRDEE